MILQTTGSKPLNVDWINQQQLFAKKYLAEKGIELDSINSDNSQFISTIAAVLHIADKENDRYWVFTGDIANDHVHIEAAKTAREATRHFALKWQLQAEKLLETKDNLQHALGVELANKAKLIQHLYEDDLIWE